MKAYAITLLLPLLLLGGCEQKQERPADTVPAAPQSNLPVPAAPRQKEKVRMKISEMGINDQGHLQVKVHNQTSVPLDLINISWFFYDRNGNQRMKGGYPHTTITTQVKDGSNSTVVGAGESKIYCNSLISVERIFRGDLDSIGDAEIKIYTRRSEFDALNLESEIECHETTIRQIFQSSRFPLRQATTTHAITSMDKNEILDSAMKKAHEGRATEMTPQEMDAFREKQLRDSTEHKRTIAARQETARQQFTEQERRIFRYMKDRWDAIAASPSGYDPDKHDDLVISEAAAKFGISKDEAKSIYIKVDGAGLDLK